MKHLVLAAIGLLALATCNAHAQDKYSASMAFDLKGKATPVIKATLDTFHSKLAFLPKDFTLNLDAFTSLETNMRLGIGLTHTWSKSFAVLDKFSPTVGLTLGPWLNYGTGAGKMSGGLYFGLGANW